jgi:hypothetical protein
MAKIKCKKCAQLISEKFNICPYCKTKLKNYYLAKFVFIIFLFFLLKGTFHFTVAVYETRAIRAKEAKEQAEIKKEFEKQKPEIIKEIQEAIQNFNYARVIEINERYNFLRDPDMIQLRNKAIRELEIDSLYETLNTLKPDEIEKKYSVLQRLVHYFPEDKTHKQNLEQTRYQLQRIQQTQQKQYEKDNRKSIIEKAFSSYNGSHINLTKMIKENMHDPRSYEHVQTQYTDFGDHIIVETRYRGNNRLGGKTLSRITAKTDLNGNVLQILSQAP